MKGIFLGLGSNIGNIRDNLSHARKLLSSGEVEIISESPEYITEPWGFKSKNKFCNQVLKIDTEIDPFSLLDHVQDIEHQMGRKKSKEKYSDRIIDIDILFYNNEIISSKPLIVPHPLLHKRAFVLQPMADIAPDFIHPIFNRPVRDLLEDIQ